eukprot:m.9811 g.9811  ORF g.9811 m.9811 type:complete len:258 (-) comp4138_c0_seq1:89-862(-)
MAKRNFCWVALACSIAVAVPSKHNPQQPLNTAENCAKSDTNLTVLLETICASIGGCPTGNITANGDWPSQVVYMNNLLQALTLPDTCLNTSVADNVLLWLENTNNVTSPWWNTWVIFQVQYYDMPRKPGARIESPATLGRKCWAFAYLAQIWTSLRPALEQDLGSRLHKFITAYDSAVPLTMNLCHEVMANCFVNASYNPSRNGTCNDRIGQYFVGYQWENGIRNDPVAYPFPEYKMNLTFQNDVKFAVNTAVNYII